MLVLRLCLSEQQTLCKLKASRVMWGQKTPNQAELWCVWGYHILIRYASTNCKAELY